MVHIPVSALPKDASKFANLLLQFRPIPFLLNIKQGSFEYQLLKSFAFG